MINGDSTWRTAGLPPGFDPAAFHSIAASKSGNQFTFLLDGVEIFREEIALPTGMAGVITEDAPVEFRKFAIREPPALKEGAMRGPRRPHRAML